MRAKSKEREEARKLKMNGMSLGKIARALNVSKGSVSGWCKDLPPEIRCIIPKVSPEQSKERKKNYQRKWRKEHRNLVLIWRQKQKATLVELNIERDKLFGDKCKICGSLSNLHIHCKKGTPHGPIRSKKIWREVENNPNDWIRLCWRCHTATHWIMVYFKWTWDDICARLDLNQ